jgi:hypothetical protein
VKLSAEQKKKLGLEAHEGEDVPDSIVLSKLEELAAAAEAGETLMGEARAECLRVATLAEADAEGTLPVALADIINKASASQLVDLTKLYTEKAAAKFKSTCQDCGSTNVSGRSSVETPSDETLENRAPAAPAGKSLFN